MPLLLLTGCLGEGPDELDELGEDSFEVIGPNGMSLNGVSLNGMSLNGMSLNGMSLNGMSLNGMSLNGMSLNGMSLNGSQLVGVTSQGHPVSGADLVGTKLSGKLPDGSILPLRVVSAETLPEPNSDVWAYGLQYRVRQGWNELCGTRDGVPILAVALSGTWNLASGVAGGGSWSPSSSKFTFGCRGTALAKCLELGYKPWDEVGGVQLRDHHQACTRMMRADYCGDGSSWTANDTLINVYDALGIQEDEADWKVDAEWSPAGALCFFNIRDFQPGTPRCEMRLRDSKCGGFTHGGLVIDEYGGKRQPGKPGSWSFSP